MTNKDLISKYVNTGIGIPRYQFDKLSNNDKKTYLRKIEISIKHDVNKIQFYYGELPEETQLYVVNIRPNMIQYLKNPTEKVQIAALEKKFETIAFIKNPTEKVQMYIVSVNPNYIEYINNPSEEVQLEAVKASSHAIEYIDNPTDKAIALHKELYGE